MLLHMDVVEMRNARACVASANTRVRVSNMRMCPTLRTCMHELEPGLPTGCNSPYCSWIAVRLLLLPTRNVNVDA